jgi:prephenate dehydratase
MALGIVVRQVVPVEDSISGTFHSVYDALLEHKDVRAAWHNTH